MIRGHRITQLKQGPDLALFTQPGILFRLGLWLTEVLRDRVAGVNISRRSKKKSLPLILACLEEKDRTYLVIGLNESVDFGDVRKKLVYCADKMCNVLTVTQRVWAGFPRCEGGCRCTNPA